MQRVRKRLAPKKANRFFCFLAAELEDICIMTSNQIIVKGSDLVGCSSAEEMILAIQAKYECTTDEAREAYEDFFVEMMAINGA